MGFHFHDYGRKGFPPPLSLPRLFVGAKQNIHGATSWATATSSFDIKAFRKCRKVVKLCHLHPDLHLTCHLGNIRQGHIGTPVMPMVPAVCMWLAALALSPSWGSKAQFTGVCRFNFDVVIGEPLHHIYIKSGPYTIHIYGICNICMYICMIYMLRG